MAKPQTLLEMSGAVYTKPPGPLDPSHTFEYIQKVHHIIETPCESKKEKEKKRKYERRKKNNISVKPKQTKTTLPKQGSV